MAAALRASLHYDSHPFSAHPKEAACGVHVCTWWSFTAAVCCCDMAPKKDDDDTKPSLPPTSKAPARPNPKAYMVLEVRRNSVVTGHRQQQRSTNQPPECGRQECNHEEHTEMRSAWCRGCVPGFSLRLVRLAPRTLHEAFFRRVYLPVPCSPPPRHPASQHHSGLRSCRKEAKAAAMEVAVAPKANRRRCAKCS